MGTNSGLKNEDSIETLMQLGVQLRKTSLKTVKRVKIKYFNDEEPACKTHVMLGTKINQSTGQFERDWKFGVY